MNKRRVVLVEDNPDDEALALRALSKFDSSLHVDVCRDGQEALEHIFESSNSQPHLILLDLKLPRVSGFDVLKRLKSDSQTRRIPVVLLTSSKEEQDRLEGYNLGANSFIRKPIDFREFTGLIQQLGEYWLRTNQPPPEQSI